MKNALNTEMAYEFARLQSRLIQQVYKYVGVHLALWLIWYVLPHTNHLLELWPVYPMAAWGINLLFLAGEVLVFEHTNRQASWSGPQAG